MGVFATCHHKDVQTTFFHHLRLFTDASFLMNFIATERFLMGVHVLRQLL
jgi:hypothetical protein